MQKRNRGLILSYAYFVLNTVLGIILTAFMVRTVGKTNYGLYQSMTAFISYLTLLEFGTGTIMSRNISLCDKNNKIEVKKNISTIWALTITLSIVIFIIAFIFFLNIDFIYSKSLTGEQIILGKKIFVFAVLNLVFGFLTQTLNGLVLGYEQYTFEKSIALIKLILRFGLIVVLLSKSAYVLYIAVVDFVLGLSVFLATMLFCLIKIKVKLEFKYFDKDILLQISPFAFAMLLQTVVNTANGSVDKFCISIMMKPEDVSVYSISMTIFTLFSSISTLPVTMYTPQIARDYKKGFRGKELTETLIQPCRLNVIVSGMITLGFALVGKQFIELVYGVDYKDSWLLALIVIIPMFFNMSNAVIIDVADVMNKRQIRSYILMITTSLNIVLTILGIKYIGMIGAAVATAFSLIGQIILLNIFYQKKLGIKVLYLFKKSYKGLLITMLISFVVAFPVKYLFNTALYQLLFSGTVFVAIFALLFFIFSSNKTEKDMLNLLINRVK